jgi:hypothetical protein
MHQSQTVTINPQKGIMMRTDFGQKFASVVGIL